MPARPTASSEACFLLNSGMLSLSALFTISFSSGNRKAGRRAAAMFYPRFDGQDALDEIGSRLDFDRPRSWNVDLVDGGDPARPCRHDRDAIGKEDRLGY